MKTDIPSFKKMEVFYKEELFWWLLGLAALVFFIRFNLQGLFADAALYAGLALKIKEQGEWWLLSASSQFFPKYFEHPPYFFQWGAWLFNFLPISDGAARLMGAIPGALGYLFCIFWVWQRFNPQVALLMGVMLATLGHYTKYAATAMLEGPLSLGVILVALTSFDWFYLQKRNFWTLGGLVLGLCLSTAAKGVAGFGAWGIVVTAAVGSIYIFPERRHQWFQALLWIVFYFLVSVLPFVFWYLMLKQQAALDYWHGYWHKQVLRSFTTNRGDVNAPSSFWYYWRVLLRNLWPWWWTVPMVWIGLLFKSKFLLSMPSLARMLAWHGFACFACFFVPFSLSRFQLPHYLHPTYLVLAPVGAWGFYVLIERWWMLFYRAKSLRWSLLLLSLVVGLYHYRGLSRSELDRGGPFILARSVINKLPANCHVIVDAPQMGTYAIESFVLWYWRGRSWSRLSHPTIALDPPANYVLWDPRYPDVLQLDFCSAF